MIEFSRNDAMSKLRSIPAVEKILQSMGETGLPRPLVVVTVRRELAEIRKEKDIPKLDAVLKRVDDALAGLRRSRIQPVINGTGVIVHTNLGRSPLGIDVVDTLGAIGARYNNLEFDLGSGKRGNRGEYLEKCLAVLCKAEAATIVNNCAAALVLILREFTATKPEVVISRGELVQIGGGFRIPDILETSGARLREIGATNKTSLRDYERAIGKETGLLLKVHRSNFFMDGFVDSPSTEELAALAKKKRVPLVEDLGSGAIVNTERFGGVEHEPTPAEVVRRGVDLVCFSGDKLLGGPQAGIIAGKRRHIAALKKNPFFRALRCDKLILAAMQTTVEAYLNSLAGKSAPDPAVPVLDMLGVQVETLEERAKLMAEELVGLPIKLKIGTRNSAVGGGTLPRSSLASVTLEIKPESMTAAEFAASLRAASPPVVGSVGSGKFHIDLRTVFPRQDQEVIDVIRGLF